MVIAFGSQMSFGVFFKPMLDEFGWTRAATSGPFSLSIILGGFLGFVSGRLSDKFGPRKVIASGSIIIGLGYFLTSRIGNLWQFYLCYGILLAIGLGNIYVPLVSMVARWFGRKRGLMAGIAISGIGLGTAITPTISSRLIESYSWRTALLVVGAANLVLIALLAQFLRNPPDDTFSLDSNRDEKANAAAHVKEYSFREAAKTRQLWMFFLAWLFYGIFFQVGMVHIVPYATDLGLSAISAAAILTAIGIVGVFGRIGLGLGGDRFGNKTIIIISFVFIAAAYLGLLVSGKVWMLYVFAVLFGCFSGIGIILAPVIAEYFGLGALGIITGTIVFANSIGGALGPTLAGYIFDTTGSYNLAFMLCAALGIIGAAIVWRLKPTSQ